VGGDHVQRLVQIPVGGGDADFRLQRQGAQVQAVAQPAQYEDDLGVHRAGPLFWPGSGAAAVPGDPAGHRLQHRCGHIQAGTMRHSGLPGKTRAEAKSPDEQLTWADVVVRRLRRGAQRRRLVGGRTAGSL
jgi:hypothetical protein